MRIDARKSSHCASACQWECAAHVFQTRARHPEQRVVDADDRLPTIRSRLVLESSS